MATVLIALAATLVSRTRTITAEKEENKRNEEKRKAAEKRKEAEEAWPRTKKNGKFFTNEAEKRKSTAQNEFDIAQIETQWAEQAHKLKLSESNISYDLNDYLAQLRAEEKRMLIAQNELGIAEDELILATELLDDLKLLCLDIENYERELKEKKALDIPFDPKVIVSDDGKSLSARIEECKGLFVEELSRRHGLHYVPVISQMKDIYFIALVRDESPNVYLNQLLGAEFKMKLYVSPDYCKKHQVEEHLVVWSSMDEHISNFLLDFYPDANITLDAFDTHKISVVPM
jgi:hypothetical protein